MAARTTFYQYPDPVEGWGELPPLLVLPGQTQRRDPDCGCQRLLAAILADAYLCLTRPTPGVRRDVAAETLAWFECPDSGLVSLRDCVDGLELMLPGLNLAAAQAAARLIAARGERLTKRGRKQLDHTPIQSDDPAAW